ncbi:hypothetical protein PanWU01x14_174700 [Parasponia andersonii]|uniref:Uncharacterized protein n=1 Tax=Parasponia andersonii TaxID=3476 RepID=A0A2P5C8J4_PARAD|nr:hypothetical protein PanWU01x14_174700 [Parasponia andersonii]
MDLRSVRLSRLGSVMDSALNSEDPHADAGITCDPRDPSHGSRLENGPHTGHLIRCSMVVVPSPRFDKLLDDCKGCTFYSTSWLTPIGTAARNLKAQY